MEHSHKRDPKNVQGMELPDTTHIHNPDVAHEESDVNTRVIVMFGVGLFIAIAITFFIVLGLFRLFESIEARSNEAAIPASQLLVRPEDRKPPEPYLQLAPYSQTHPLVDWDNFQKSQDEVATKGMKGGVTVGIPVQQAKEQLIQKGLPSRSTEGNQLSTSNWMDIPSYSSSGRMMEKRDR
jgi:hypothetical protein